MILNTNISPLKDIKALNNLIKILKDEKPFDVLHLHSAKAEYFRQNCGKNNRTKKSYLCAARRNFFTHKMFLPLREHMFAMPLKKPVSIFPAKIVGVSKSEADAYHKDWHESRLCKQR